MHLSAIVLAIVLHCSKIHGQGSTEQGTASYSIYNGQMQYTPEQPRPNWFSSLIRSMDFLNLFNSQHQGSPQQPGISPYQQPGIGPYQQRPSPYLEEGASNLAQQSITPQSPYSVSPEVPVNIPNANSNYAIRGAYRGQAGNVPDVGMGSIFPFPATNPQKPKDLSFYHGQYRSDGSETEEFVERSFHSREAPVYQPPNEETPYAKKQKKQCNKQINYQQPDADTSSGSQDYMKKPCRKKATTSTESSKYEHQEEEKGAAEEDETENGDDADDEEKDEVQNPCPPIGLWFWNGEVCIASGPVPTWACKPRDLVTTGRVATCRNKVYLPGPGHSGRVRGQANQNSS